MWHPNSARGSSSWGFVQQASAGSSQPDCSDFGSSLFLKNVVFFALFCFFLCSSTTWGDPKKEGNSVHFLGAFFPGRFPCVSRSRLFSSGFVCARCLPQPRHPTSRSHRSLDGTRFYGFSLSFPEVQWSHFGGCLVWGFLVFHVLGLVVVVWGGFVL